MMQVQPYLSFDGKCEEALDFYKKAIGAEVVMLMRWKEAPDQSMVPPGNADKIMHARFRVGDASVMASDGRRPDQPGFGGFALNLTASDPAAADRLFGALAQGGQVQMPLGKTFFSPAFGMVVDRFGVPWMVYVEA
jgi:PhnB protein